MTSPAPKTMTEAEILAELTAGVGGIGRRQDLIGRLAEIGTSTSIPVIGELVNAPDLRLRCSALRGLQRIGGPQAFELLLSALDHQDPTTVAWAAHMLRRTGDPVAGPKLIHVAHARWEALDSDAQTAIVITLRELHDEAAAPVFRRGLTSHDRGLIRMCANALAHMGTDESHGMLDWALTTLEPRQRRAVLRGIRGRRGPLKRWALRVVDGA